MRSINVNSATSIVELTKFLKGLDKEGLRSKKLPNGDYLLYTSKGPGTGLKNRLFKTIDKRRLLAESIIESIGQNAQRAVPADDKIFFGERLKEDMDRGEITANTAQDFVLSVAQKAALPAGVNLDEAGNLSGSCTLNNPPTKGPIARAKVEIKNKKLTTYIQEFNQKPLEREINLGSEEVEEMQSIDSSSWDDLFRNKYEIPQPDGGIFKPHEEEKFQNTEKEKVQNERRFSVICALKEFAGSASATRILTSFSQQRIPIAFVAYLRTADGQTMDFLRMIKLSDRTRTLFIVEPDGTKRELTEKEKLGLGNAVYKFGKRGDDFVISIDLKSYAEANHGSEDIFPLDKDHVIGIDYQAEIIVNGKKAHTGILEVERCEVTTRYSGRLKSDSQTMRDLKSIALSFDEAGNAQLPVSSDLVQDESKLSRIFGLSSAIIQYMEVPYINNKKSGKPPFESDAAIESMFNIIKSREERNANLQNLLAQKNVDDSTVYNSAVALSKQMTEDLKSLKFGCEFFTNEEEFISKLPPKDQQTVREFGQHLAAYYKSLIEPNGQYMCLSRIAGLAMNSPADLSAALKRYRSENFDKSQNMPAVPKDELDKSEGSQVLIDPQLLAV